jgi:Flp pilus assembly CpaF family ATPase
LFWLPRFFVLIWDLRVSVSNSHRKRKILKKRTVLQTRKDKIEISTSRGEILKQNSKQNTFGCGQIQPRIANDGAHDFQAVFPETRVSGSRSGACFMQSAFAARHIDMSDTTAGRDAVPHEEVSYLNCTSMTKQSDV